MFVLVRVFSVFLQGELSYDGHQIRVFDFLTQRSTNHTAGSNIPVKVGLSGHGGADYHLINAFISAVAVSVSFILVFFCQIYIYIYYLIDKLPVVV